MINLCNYTTLVSDYNRLFRDMNAALIVFDVQEKKSFLSAVSDQTLPDGTTRRSWFKIVNNKGGDVPPVKILGKYHYNIIL